jgi:hypothetical protein
VVSISFAWKTSSLEREGRERTRRVGIGWISQTGAVPKIRRRGRKVANLGSMSTPNISLAAHFGRNQKKRRTYTAIRPTSSEVLEVGIVVTQSTAVRFPSTDGRIRSREICQCPGRVAVIAADGGSKAQCKDVARNLSEDRFDIPQGVLVTAAPARQRRESDEASLKRHLGANALQFFEHERPSAKGIDIRLVLVLLATQAALGQMNGQVKIA